MISEESLEIATTIMRELQYDNGCIFRGKKEKYPKLYLNSIAKTAGYFFKMNPNLLNNEVINDICCGESGERNENYSHLIGYKGMDDSIKNYFDNLV